MLASLPTSSYMLVCFHVSRAFGDPHFRTFDGIVYTFNGAGEFWLMRTDDVQKDGQMVQYELQGRLEPVMSTYAGRNLGVFVMNAFKRKYCQFDKKLHHLRHQKLSKCQLSVHPVKANVKMPFAFQCMIPDISCTVPFFFNVINLSDILTIDTPYFACKAEI